MARLREDRLDEPNMRPATPIPESAQRQAAIVAGTLNPTPANRNAGAAAGAANVTDADNTLAGLQPQLDELTKQANDFVPPTGGGGGGGGAPTVVGAPVLGGDGYYHTQLSDGTWITGVQGQSTTKLGGGGDPGALQIITDVLNQAGLGSLAGNALSMWNKGFNIRKV